MKSFYFIESLEERNNRASRKPLRGLSRLFPFSGNEFPKTV